MQKFLLLFLSLILILIKNKTKIYEVEITSKMIEATNSK